MKKFILFMLLSVSAVTLFAEKPKADGTKLPTFTYYYYDGWMMCSKITAIVNGLKKEYGTKVVIKTIAVKAEGSKEAIKIAKLKGHGIVGKDTSGKIIVAISGHNYKKDKVVGAFTTLVGSKK